MWYRLRSPLIVCALVLLFLPLSASSAVPAVVGILRAAVAIAGVAWTGFNLTFIGARSAAFAQADEIWVSDPPNVTRAALQAGTFEANAAEWNTGRASSVSRAPAEAPSGNAITVQAETHWEPISFAFTPTIKMENQKLANPDGFLWGQGFAFATFEGVVTKEYGPWGREDKADPLVAEIPLTYTIFDVSLRYQENLYVTSLELNLIAWKLDRHNVKPIDSSWQEEIPLASISLDGPNFDHLHLDGNLDKTAFIDTSSSSEEMFHVRLEEPIKREVVLRVPFPSDAERVVIRLRAEATATVQIGKG